jgi:hypothetical protein
LARESTHNTGRSRMIATQGKQLLAGLAAVLIVVQTANAAQPASAVGSDPQAYPRQSARSRSQLYAPVYRVAVRRVVTPPQSSSTTVTRTVRSGVRMGSPAPAANTAYKHASPFPQRTQTSLVAASTAPRGNSALRCECLERYGFCNCENCACNHYRNQSRHGANCNCAACRVKSGCTCGAAPAQCRCGRRGQRPVHAYRSRRVF